MTWKRKQLLIHENTFAFLEAQHKVCSCELDIILASKRKTIKQDLCCWVVCAIPSQAGGNRSPLFVIFFNTFIGFFLHWEAAVPVVVFNRYTGTEIVQNCCICWGSICASIPVCSTCTPRFPLLRLHVIRPTPRSGMEVEGKEEEKTRGKNRGRRSKPVEQV